MEITTAFANKRQPLKNTLACTLNTNPSYKVTLSVFALFSSMCSTTPPRPFAWGYGALKHTPLPLWTLSNVIDLHYRLGPALVVCMTDSVLCCQHLLLLSQGQNSEFLGFQKVVMYWSEAIILFFICLCLPFNLSEIFINQKKNHWDDIFLKISSL